METLTALINIREKIENFDIFKFLTSFPEIEWIDVQVENYFLKKYPNFSRKVYQQLNEWCSNDADQFGWHPNWFERLLLIAGFSYFAMRTAIILLLPGIISLLLFWLLI